MSKTLYLYDVISQFFGLGAADFIAALNAIPAAEEVTIRINSPGGDLDQAIAIHNAIARRKAIAPVAVEIDALAASAASYVAIAGTTIGMAENAIFMIHRPYTIAMGNADEMRKTAEVLDKYQGIITAGYAKRSDQPIETVESWLADETWFTAQEAKDAGFADHVGETSDVAANLDGMRFSRIPEALLGRMRQEPMKQTSPTSRELMTRRLWIARRRAGL